MQSSNITDEKKGLSENEVSIRLKEFGPNLIPASPKPSVWNRLFQQFKSPLIYILIVAFCLDILMWLFEDINGWPIEGIAIAAILILNASLGVWQEKKSENALDK